MVSECPACHHTLVVRRLQCPSCHTAVEGEFPFDFLALRPDEAQFARAFLLARGNLRELERTLGVSYTALRGRLDAVTERLDPQLRTVVREAGGARSPAPGQAERDDARQGDHASTERVLAALESGSISVDDALRTLRKAAPGP